jgi:hypothetical protein
MRRTVFAAVLALTAASTFGQPGTASWIYFRMDWCPTKAEVSALSEHLELSMSGCCIISGKPRTAGGIPPAALQPFRDHVAEGYEGRKCRGVDEDTKAAAAAEQEALRRDIPQLVPRVLQGISKDEFCVAFGLATRDRRIVEEHPVVDEVPSMAAVEAKRRKLQFNMPRVMSQTLQVGDTRCQMLAALGEPRTQNRTVTSGAVRLQHIYGRKLLVYTTNDVVTAFQD